MGGKFIQFTTLIETSSFGKDTQAKVLGISTSRLTKAWNCFGYRKLSPGTTRFLHSGEHGFDENIMERLGFNKDVHVSVLVWYALLDAKTRNEVNNDAAKTKRSYAKAKQTSVKNEKGEMVTKAQLRNQLQHEKEKQTIVENEKGETMTKAQLRDQLRHEKEKQTIVENEKGETMTKAQLRRQLRYEKEKQTIVENEKGEMVTQAQLKYEKKKQRNKEFIRIQFIHRPPDRLQKEECSICGRKKSFGWAKAPDALWYVEKLFKEKGLKEYPSIKATNGYLTMKKRKYLGKEDILLRSTDILCYACWKTCEGAAERTMQKLLKL